MRRAVGEERIEGVLRPDRLGTRRLDAVEVGIDRAVEHHRSDALREQRRVGGAELTAVRKPHVGDRVLAESDADALEVVGSVDSRDLAEQVARGLLAGIVELLRPVDEHLVLRFVVR